MDSTALDTLLKSQPALWRGRDRYTHSESVPTGYPALNDALPSQGWPVGGVTELLLDQQGIGELSLLLPGLRHVTGGQTMAEDSNRSSTDTNRWAALVNPPHIPYAPAFINAGIQLDKLLIVECVNDTDTLWATEQILRSGLFGAVIAWVRHSNTSKQRRLQLAAEYAGCWASIYRPLHARKEHSPVTARICLESVEQQLALHIIKIRAGNLKTVYIRPDEFDASQGAEWPAPLPDGTDKPGIITIKSTALSD